ncbi:MAG: S-layer homology domain-containing protein, partial [Nanoarchaeota archaeon]
YEGGESLEDSRNPYWYFKSEGRYMSLEDIMSVGGMTTRCTAFCDVGSKNVYYCSSLEAGLKEGWIKGYFGTDCLSIDNCSKNSHCFKPLQDVNRAEFAKMLVEIMDIELDEELDEHPFTDVDKDKWYGPYIAALKRENIVDGETLFNGYFTYQTYSPERSITRPEAIKMIFEAIDFKGKDCYEELVSEDQQDEWYATYIGAAFLHGILNPLKFDPEEPLQRAEIVKILHDIFPIANSTQSIDFGSKDCEDEEKVYYNGKLLGTKKICEGNYCLNIANNWTKEENIKITEQFHKRLSNNDILDIFATLYLEVSMEKKLSPRKEHDEILNALDDYFNDSLSSDAFYFLLGVYKEKEKERFSQLVYDLRSEASETYYNLFVLIEDLNEKLTEVNDNTQDDCFHIMKKYVLCYPKTLEERNKEYEEIFKNFIPEYIDARDEAYNLLLYLKSVFIYLESNNIDIDYKDYSNIDSKKIMDAIGMTKQIDEYVKEPILAYGEYKSMQSGMQANIELGKRVLELEVMSFAIVFTAIEIHAYVMAISPYVATRLNLMANSFSTRFSGIKTKYPKISSFIEERPSMIYARYYYGQTTLSMSEKHKEMTRVTDLMRANSAGNYFENRYMKYRKEFIGLKRLNFTGTSGKDRISDAFRPRFLYNKGSIIDFKYIRSSNRLSKYNKYQFRDYIFEANRRGISIEYYFNKKPAVGVTNNMADIAKNIYTSNKIKVPIRLYYTDQNGKIVEHPFNITY